MAGVEGLDKPLQRTTLAAGVPALEQDQQPRSQLARAQLAPEVEAELEEPPLRVAQPGLVLRSAQPLAQVELFQAGAHRADHTERDEPVQAGRRRVARMRLASVLHQGAPHAARLTEGGQSAVILAAPDVGALLGRPREPRGRG